MANAFQRFMDRTGKGLDTADYGVAGPENKKGGIAPALPDCVEPKLTSRLDGSWPGRT